MNSSRSSLTVTLIAAVIAPCVGLAQAADPAPQIPASVTQSVIGPYALSGVRGRAAVNEAAGDSNAQSSAAALVVGTGLSSATVSAMQNTVGAAGNQPGAMSASIGDHAFANASGLVSINQTSGVANAQANSATLGVGSGVEIVTDSVLAATASNAGPAGDGTTKTSRQAVSIADTAFDGARGLVQVNQSAGSGNATANTFALRVQPGVTP
ncbi:MAG TPA: hypothetical protein VFM11_08950 [Burkholderiales bacterium]|nr:hypothetical protein [Burkholderiales bacterium]